MTTTATEMNETADGADCSDLPVNYDQYIKFMNLTEWPGTLTSETILSLRDEMSGYRDIDSISSELRADTAINWASLELLEQELQRHNQFLMAYANRILDVSVITEGAARDRGQSTNEAFERLGARVRERSKQVASRRPLHHGGSGDGHGDGTELGAVSIEWLQYPGYDEDEFNPLPGGIDALRTMHCVMAAAAAGALRAPVSFRSMWKQIFTCEASIGVVHDVFWWFFLDIFKSGSDNELDKTKLFCRIALDYGLMIVAMPGEVAQRFLPPYPSMLAMTMYRIFYHAFPTSRKLFGADFKEKLSSTCHLWVTGLQPLRNSFASWPFDQLHASEDGSTAFDVANELGQDLFPRPEQITSSETAPFDYYSSSTILFDPRRCSPLIERFLQLHDIEPRRSLVAGKCCRRTELEPVPGHGGLAGRLKEHDTKQQSMRALHVEATAQHEAELRSIASNRRNLERRFQQMQRDIDQCGSALDMRALLLTLQEPKEDREEPQMP